MIQVAVVPVEVGLVLVVVVLVLVLQPLHGGADEAVVAVLAEEEDVNQRGARHFFTYDNQ